MSARRSAQRRLIALRAPAMRSIDPRPRCEDCGAVLSQADVAAYLDGQSAAALKRHGQPQAPRCCAECAEVPS